MWGARAPRTPSVVLSVLQEPIALRGLIMHPPFPLIPLQKNDHPHHFSLAK